MGPCPLSNESQLREGECEEVRDVATPTAQVTSDKHGSGTLEHGTRQDLNHGAAKTLENKAWSLVPGLFQDLVSHERTVLMEVCCAPDSTLSTVVRQMAGYESAASQCALWNACDLGTKEGLQLVLSRIDLEQPVMVWMSPPVGPYSPLQNLNSRTQAQQEALNQKRLEARRVYVSCCVIFQYCLQQGIHVAWEMSERSLAWRLPMLQKLKQKFGLWDVVTKGCSVNLREAPQGKFLQRGWRILTTHQRIARLLDMPCRCPKSYSHARCSGPHRLSGDSYTKEFAQRVATGVLQELEFSEVLKEGQGETQLCELFGVGDACFCEDLKIPNLPEQKCTKCWQWGLRSEVKGSSEGTVKVQGKPGGFETAQAGTPQVEAQVFSTSDSKGSGFQVDKADSEDKARDLLEKGRFTMKALEELLGTSNIQPPHRNPKRACRFFSEYLTLGMYSHGGFYGQTKATAERPWLTRYLNQFARKHLPKEAQWTSVTISRNNKLPAHRDQHNHAKYPSHIVGVGNYKGGELWVYDPELTEQSQNALPQVHEDGTRLLGQARATRHKVTQFWPKEWHATCPWEGERITVTFYVSRGWGCAAESVEQGWLFQLGSFYFGFRMV